MTTNDDSNVYVTFFNIYYIIYFILATLFQIILIYLIKTRSPATLDNLKKFLCNTSYIQLALISLTFFQQHRLVQNPTTLAVLALGPCRYLGPHFCFTGYHLFMGTSLAVGLAISITVLFRYLVLVMNNVTHTHIHIIIAIAYIAPIIVVILPFTSKWDFPLVQHTTFIEHPTYNLSIYEPYPGFSDVQSIPFLIATAMLGIGVYGIPLACLVLTRRVLSLIQYHQHMSEKTKKQSQTLVYGLAVQTVLPFISYIPSFSSYVYVQMTGEPIVLNQHLILASSSLPGLVDPLISFYFIVPYRQTILEKLRITTKQRDVLKVGSSSTATVSNVVL